MSSIFYQNLQCKSKLALVYMHMTLILSPLERLYRTEQALASVRTLCVTYINMSYRSSFITAKEHQQVCRICVCVCVCVCVSEIIQGKPSVYQNR